MGNQKESEILDWIEQAVANERFENKEIALTGTADKTEGYASDVVFAQVSGVDALGNNKEVNLVVKIGKQDKTIREQFYWMRDAYIREIVVYEKILPAFRAFQEEKKSRDRFEAFPKCYATFLSDTSEVLVLENLKKQGFKMHSKNTPMNMQHLKLVLKNYAKFHALSFALRDQKAEEYKALTSDYDRHSISFFENFGDTFGTTSKKVVRNLIEASRKDLAEQYEVAFKSNSILDVLKAEVEHTVITHGDCHNNNFMFQYRDDDDTNPTGIAILDWQVSLQHSPVMDLSNFLYAVAGPLIYKLPELLEFYHSNLVAHAKGLGTNLDQVFPFSSLVRDWRKYAYYGFVSMATFMEMLLVKKEDAPAFENMKDGDNPMDVMLADVNVEDRGEYRNRLIQIVDQYCNHQL